MIRDMCNQQGSFRVCAQPMRDDVTMESCLSLAGHIHRMTPEPVLRNDRKCVEKWQKMQIHFYVSYNKVSTIMVKISIAPWHYLVDFHASNVVKCMERIERLGFSCGHIQHEIRWGLRWLASTNQRRDVQLGEDPVDVVQREAVDFFQRSGA